MRSHALRTLFIAGAALAASLAMFVGTSSAGWVQLPPPDPSAGYVQVSCPDGTTDKTCPAARRYAKRMLHGYVRAGLLARYMPEWNDDPAAVWRYVSALYANALKGCVVFGECGP